MNIYDFDDIEKMCILGFPVKELIFVAQLLKENRIDEINLHDSFEMYGKGFVDGQKIVQTSIEKTVNDFKLNFSVGNFGDSFVGGD